MCRDATTGRQTVKFELPDLPLETERLELRDYVAQDWAAVHRYNRSEAFCRYLPIAPQTPDTTKAFLEQALHQQRQTPRLEYSLAVIDKALGKPIGGVRIGIKEGADRVASIGYAFDPEYWGRGCATEAVGRIVVLGFEHFGLHRVFALCDPENTGSIGVLEKLGMRREGHLRKQMLIRGEWRDSLLYAIIEEEYASLTQG